MACVNLRCENKGITGKQRTSQYDGVNVQSSPEHHSLFAYLFTSASMSEQKQGELGSLSLKHSRLRLACRDELSLELLMLVVESRSIADLAAGFLPRCTPGDVTMYLGVTPDLQTSSSPLCVAFRY